MLLTTVFLLPFFIKKDQAHKELNGKDLVLDGKTRYGSKFTVGDRLNNLKVPIRENWLWIKDMSSVMRNMTHVFAMF